NLDIRDFVVADRLCREGRVGTCRQGRTVAGPVVVVANRNRIVRLNDDGARVVVVQYTEDPTVNLATIRRIGAGQKADGVAAIIDILEDLDRTTCLRVFDEALGQIGSGPSKRDLVGSRSGAAPRATAATGAFVGRAQQASRAELGSRPVHAADEYVAVRIDGDGPAFVEELASAALRPLPLSVAIQLGNEHIGG